jgi:hypothetical protein
MERRFGPAVFYESLHVSVITYSGKYLRGF